MFRRLMQFTSLLSLVSVSANTPQSFKNYPELRSGQWKLSRTLLMRIFHRYITYVADWFCLLAFSLEAVMKIKKRGMFNPETGYCR